MSTNSSTLQQQQPQQQRSHAVDLNVSDSPLKSTVSNESTNNGAKPVRGHKRQQASIGLGIITTNLDMKDPSSSHQQQQQQQEGSKNHDEQASTNDRTKTDAFFSTSTLSVPRPPPPLASSISASSPRRSSDSAHGPISAPIAMNDNEVLLEDDDDMGSSRRMTFANRLRHLVAANKMAPPAPSPIPNNYRQHASSSSPSASTTATTLDKAASSGLQPTGHRSYSSSSTSSSDDDEIMPLPSPAPGSASMHSRQHRLFPKHPIVSPPQLSPVTPTSEDDKPPEHVSDNTSATTTNTTTTTTTTAPSSSALEPPSQSIPVIVTSPSWTPGRPKNKLPSLSEEPMLGDLDDVVSTTNHKLAPPTMNREYKFPSPSPMQYTEEDIVGKQIGDYKIRRLIGVGAFSKVYLATRINDGVEFAIKMINKDRIASDARIRSSIEREVGVLKFIDHPSIVHLEATMETEQHLCIVMEYAQGGELFDFVQKMHQSRKPVDEELIRRIFTELLHVVLWLHEHNIVHRDLKLENILIHMDKDGHPRLKVTDFGLARVIDPTAPILTTRCGSEEYAAPEIVQSMGYDGRRTDTWAVGIILYALLVGYLPFMYNPARGEKVSHLYYRIVSAEYRWPSADWQQHPERTISTEARQVVERILKRQPDKRINLADIETLPWFTKPISDSHASS
ncbi:cbl-interacting serine threonine-protein kinase16 [Lichtheimia corymbifera JMRC:FSU:9682]|uniref:non-specific serine/threonine protein kinase n=1 Tax=Lichtheimia corymbifera JMRC:FSU:9682 TaxID=1263082 RepID=A0A068RS42_9FUNG|nr:cbl-interacting serine threonine-protein kinase16 [Lichtheimia corymbifera JMRC:FSU:9682]